MTRHRSYALAGGVALAAACSGCGEHGTDDPLELRSATSALAAWTHGNLSHVLRVNQGETAVRSICELTIPLSSVKPLTFLASSSAGGVWSGATSLGWNGNAVSSGALSVSGCNGVYPCEVVARFRGAASNGSTLGCELIADDGISRLVGKSSGTALTVVTAPAQTVIVNQDVKIGSEGTPIAASCVLRQSAQLPGAAVSDFEVLVDGLGQVNLPGPTPIGTLPWPSSGPAVPLGSIFVGVDASATRLKHVIARKHQLGEGAQIRCGGVYSDGSPVFDVNVSGTPAGDGMSLTRDVTGWTCDASMFGTQDGCDCDCGIVDPDCSGTACPVCGNGVREAPEQCDDGALVNLDGCDSACRFEQVHRANYLKMQFGVDTSCTANQLGSAFVGATVRSQQETGLDTSIADGSTSWILLFRGLDDLSGSNDASLQLGMLSGTPVAGANYSGTSDTDWWYTISSAVIDAQRQPTAVLDASAGAGVLSAGPGSFVLQLTLAGVPAQLSLSNATLSTSIGATSVPIASTGTTPGHLASENLDPALASFATLGETTITGAGALCSNVSAASLANVPIPVSLTGSGLFSCSQAYTTANTLLDLVVGGCTILGIQQVAPKQPDRVDANAPVAGAGGPYTLQASSLTKAVNTCRDKNNAIVDLSTCLNAAAYSSYFRFATGRVIAK